MSACVCKMILLGNGSVGKSSLIARFVANGFQKEYKQTVGIDFFNKKLTIKNVNIVIQIWDIGGQNLASKMLDKYIYGCQVVFLCYDITDRQSFTDLSDWLALARRALAKGDEASSDRPSSNVDMYLLGNKSDLEHLRQVSEVKHEQKIRSEDFAGGCLVSAKNGERLLETVYKAAAKVAHVTLSAHDLEFLKRTIVATVDVTSNDEKRTKMADQIEAEDREARDAAAQRQGCCTIS